MAPYSWSADRDSKRQPAQTIMAVVLDQPSEMVVIDQDGEVGSEARGGACCDLDCMGCSRLASVAAVLAWHLSLTR